MKKALSNKHITVLLMLVYFSSYITRINFAAIIQEIITATGFGKEALSVIPVCLSITYGAGQVVNGMLSDRIKPQTMIFCGLACVSTVNIIFPLFANSVIAMCILWAINGFAQAMMWPPIVQIIVRCMHGKDYESGMFWVSCGSSFGTIAVYLLAPLIITLLGWRAVFFICAGTALLVTVLFGILRSRIEMPPLPVAPQTAEKKRGFAFPNAALLPILLIGAGIILQGMLRDGVSTWMPTFLVEVFGFTNTTSILITVVLAVFSIIAFGAAGRIYHRFFKNEVFFAGIIFGVATLCSLFLLFFFDATRIGAIIGLMLINGCAHGINLMLISYVPKRFRCYGSISTISGCLNACTYVGSAISTYGIAVLVERLGWGFTIGSWIIIAALGTAACFAATLPWHKFFNLKPEENSTNA